MIYHRTCSFSLSHLTHFKQNELHTTYQFFQEAGQHYIHALAQLTPNLVLHNQSLPKDQQIQKLHGDTKALYQPKHISSRWLSKISKQSYESLMAIDSKQSEQAYVKTHSKRKSQLPKNISAPNLDGSLISIQFKTDDPTLLMAYPTHLISEKETQNKHGETVKKIIKTPTKVSAFTSEQWKSQFGLVAFDMVIRLSRIRGNDIKHSQSILIIPLKQHEHFLHWLHQPNSKLLDCVVLNQTSLRKASKAKPLTKKELNNRLNVHLCFECTQSEIPTACNVINISERSCPAIGTYEVSSTQASHLALKKYLKTVPKENIYGLDVGHCKLGVLTNQDEASLESQAKSLFIGTDHPDRMTQKGEVLFKYRKALSLNQKKTVSAKTENIPYQSQMMTEQSKDKIYITTTLKKLFQERQASAEPIKVLVMENLNKIKIGGSDKKSLGKKFNKRNALWVVRQVQSWVVHYCQQNGILCVLVDPRFTSKQCPLCCIVPELHKRGSNRSGESYLCRCCTKETFDSDYVGAHNIRQRLLFWMKMGSMPFSKKKKTEEVKSVSDRKELKQNSGSPAPLSMKSHTP